MAEKKRRRGKAPRQNWHPNFLLRILNRVWRIAFSAVKVAAGAVATVLLIGIVCGFVFVTLLGQYLQDDIIPQAQINIDDLDMEKTSYIYYKDENGNYQILQQLATTMDRRWVAFEDIPEDLIHAAVAIEDKRFYEHQGVDWITTMKACVNMFFGSGSQFGGSTLTQQLVKNILLMEDENADDVTVQRKILEIFRALEFEKTYSKEVVVEYYMNTVYFGSSCYGVKSAAEHYFGKELQDLNTSEFAALIGITNNPSMFNPFSQNEYMYKGEMTLGVDRNRVRQVNTLWTMRNEGYLTEEVYQEALEQEMVFKTGISDDDKLAHCPDSSCGYYSTVSDFRVEDGYACPVCGTATDVDTSASQEVYSWFTEAVMDDVCIALAAMDGVDWNTASSDVKKEYANKLKIGGYHIYTTLDMEVQKEVDRVYTDLTQIPKTKSTQQLWSAMVIVDNETGDIVAMAGNVGEKTTYDALSYATEAKLQTGSTQKPLSVYAPAFEAGVITPASVVSDMPMAYYNGTPYPRNDNRKYQYARSIYSGIVRSVNAISINTLKELGLENAYTFAKEKFRLQGLTNDYVNANGTVMSDIDYSPLGMGALTTGVTVRDMAVAYATFANNGVYREGRTFTKVYDSEGNLVIDNTQITEQILSEKTVNYMNYCLTAAVEGGTGTAAQISGQTVAGKTGTTSSNRDRWFCGYTNYYTAAVWCGYQWPEVIKLVGDTSNPACRLFKKVLTPVHEGLDRVKLYDNTNFRSYSMCLDSGMRASDGCVNVTSAYAYSGDVTVGYCDKHTYVDYCSVGGAGATEYCRLMGASVSKHALVKLDADEVEAIRKALGAGLTEGYPGEGRVYYTGGSWHGYSGNTQPGNQEHYLSCSVHTAAAYQDYLNSQTPVIPDNPEGGESNG